MSESINQSINIGLVKDGKTHRRTKVSEKSTTYKIYDNVKSVTEWHHSGFYWNKDDGGGAENWRKRKRWKR